MSKRSKGSYIGGSTVITVRQSDKRMAERQDYWRRKLGHDQIVQLRAVGGDDPPRLIKASEMPPAKPPAPPPIGHLTGWELPPVGPASIVLMVPRPRRHDGFGRAPIDQPWTLRMRAFRCSA